MDIREFVKKYVGYGAVQKFEDFLFYLRFGKIVLNTKGTNRVIIKMGGNEVDIMCDDDEVIRNLSSSHEIKNVGIYMKYLNEYNVYIDIGANIGVYLVLASFIMDKKKKLLGNLDFVLFYEKIDNRVHRHERVLCENTCLALKKNKFLKRGNEGCHRQVRLAEALLDARRGISAVHRNYAKK